MTVAALALIVAAAFVHAGWNLLAKRAGGGAIFLWMFSLVATVVYAPLAALWMIFQPFHMGVLGWVSVSGTVVLHSLYFISLQRGYRAGDLSVVYPLARGTGPLLATLAALLVFHERPSPLAFAGIALILVGVFTISGGLQIVRRKSSLSRVAIGYGLLTGVFIASYTLLDKYAVGVLMLPPLVYDWLSNVGRVLVVSPYALTRRSQVAAEWRASKIAVIGVGIMSPLAYILVLTALSFTPVSYVAPAREISILVGVILGARLLAEGQVLMRLTAAVAIVAGIVALMLG